MIKKALFGAAIALAAAAGVAAPASADPSPFGTLGCTCTSPAAAPDGKAPVKDQLDQGIKNGLGFLKAPPNNS
ncbi:hypothetical protein [Mycobacterium sp.]|uniref:hypothetical protein n=1 Tax=Mycobacterium sp. TaxID=1785 RepID=UPI002B5A6B20|nr:hypothetical protein [Mycobacterium sp.]HXB84954.1 hypothetical protein [Mycobacterium sp.]